MSFVYITLSLRTVLYVHLASSAQILQPVLLHAVQGAIALVAPVVVHPVLLDIIVL
jgi:hypothetical protein